MFADGKHDISASCRYDRFDFVEHDIFDLVKSDYSVLADCAHCEVVEKCLDVTAGTALLSHKVMSEELPQCGSEER